MSLRLDEASIARGVGRYSATTFGTRLSDLAAILWAFENPGDTIVQLVGIWAAFFNQSGSSAEAILGLYKTEGASAGGVALAQPTRLSLRGAPNRCRVRRPNAADAGTPTAITSVTILGERIGTLKPPNNASAAGMLSDGHPAFFPASDVGTIVEPGYGLACRIDGAGNAGDRINFTLVWDVWPAEAC